jgi:hypothetical protein
VPGADTSGLPRIAQWLGILQKRKRSLTDDEQIAWMDLLIEHLAAEHERDLPRTMQTISDRGRYNSWGGRNAYTATTAEQEAIYRTGLEASPNTFNLTLEIERCFSGADGICMDGVLHKEFTGPAVLERGLQLPEGADQSDTFVVSRRLALFVSFLDGLMAGEDMYRDDFALVTTAKQWARTHSRSGP